MKPANGVIEPGGTIGILGGGQLGRMLSIAAARLGYRTIIFAPDQDCIAAEVADARIDSPYDDQAALKAFATRVDVITIEFENVPAASLDYLAQWVPVGPGSNILAVTQDRLAEKAFSERLGIGVAGHLVVNNSEDIEIALNRFDSGILKTRRMGYDGKGQLRLAPGADAAQAFQSIGGQPAIFEALVPFEREISVITARGWSGKLASFPAVENSHKNGILDTTKAPAVLPDQVMREAKRIAEAIAQEFELVGLIAVEMFLLGDGRLLVNEMAPRPHNSGHWTIDACAVSQFELAIRAICGLPLGDPSVCRPALMQNLIGHDVDRWSEWLDDPNARLHLYGKKETRDGRKMGHVTWVD